MTQGTHEGEDQVEERGESMNEASVNPLEAILRLCAAAAPQPWYPRQYAKSSGIDLAELNDPLERLWLEGLIRKAPGAGETGPGIVLTPEGEGALEDPEAMERLRTGQPVVPQSRAAIIRQALRQRTRPWITRLLLLANLAVFACGAWLASNVGKSAVFLKGFPVQDPAVLQIAYRTGAVGGFDLVQRDGWRLLSATFVHFGLLHLLLNMYMLYAAGSSVERLWGHWRYVVIYFFSAWGGSCVAVAYNPGGLDRGVPVPLFAGASGALCGVLAAEAVWVLLNGRFLPREVLRQARTNMVSNGLLIVLISLFAGVSGLGHLGGAVAGAATALLLNVQRFSRAPLNLLATVALLALPWAAYIPIDRQRVLNPAWHELEALDFKRTYKPRIRDTIKAGDRMIKDTVRPLLEMHPTRRDKAAIEGAGIALSKQQEELNALAKHLRQAGPFRDALTEEARSTALNYCDARAGLFRLAERCLREGANWTDKEEETLDRQQSQVDEVRGALDRLLR
jgi:membrane associated rhomboid family serine protease